MKLFAGNESFADELSAFGQEDIACAVRETIRRAREELQEFWDESVTVSDAAAWGGYSESQLRRLMSDGTVQATPDKKIRRRHVPVKPGHVMPLGLDPVESSDTSWRERVRQQREAS